MLTACHAGQIPGCTVRTGPRHLCRILLLRSPQATLTPEPPGPGQLAAPVMVAEQRLWLAAAGRRRDEPFDDADRDLLKAPAAVGSGALRNAELFRQVRLEREKLHHHAFYDSLTGLANRRLLVERLDQALQRSAVDRQAHALIFIDVDRFKSINDSLGHVTGDEFLVAIGSRMKNVMRSRDLLARFGGDEFVAVLEDVAGVDVPVAAARRICAALERPIVLRDGYEVVASVSVGMPCLSRVRAPMTSSTTRTWRCMTPRPRAGAASTGSSTRSPWEAAPPSESGSRPTCARDSNGVSSRSTISPSTPSGRSASWARRRWCDGATRPTASSARRNS